MVGFPKFHALIKSRGSVMVADVRTSTPFPDLYFYITMRMPVVPVNRTYSPQNGTVPPAAQTEILHRVGMHEFYGPICEAL